MRVIIFDRDDCRVSIRIDVTFPKSPDSPEDSAAKGQIEQALLVEAMKAISTAKPQ